MPQGMSGLRTGSGGNIILDTGMIYVNIDVEALTSETALTGEETRVGNAIETATPLGATSGGATFNPARTLRQIPVDGLLGPAMGFVRRQNSAPTLTVNLIEATIENLQYAIAGLVTEAAGDFTRITGGEITDESYLENVALFTRYKATQVPIVLVIYNALAHEAPSIGLTHGSESVLAVTFTGHVDPAAPNAEVWDIFHPGTPLVPPA